MENPVGLRMLRLCIGLGLGPCLAALTYPGCADFKAGDFHSVPVVGRFNHASIQEPLKMAFDRP